MRSGELGSDVGRSMEGESMKSESRGTKEQCDEELGGVRHGLSIRAPRTSWEASVDSDEDEFEDILTPSTADRGDYGGRDERRTMEKFSLTADRGKDGGVSTRSVRSSSVDTRALENARGGVVGGSAGPGGRRMDSSTVKKASFRNSQSNRRRCSTTAGTVGEDCEEGAAGSIPRTVSVSRKQMEGYLEALSADVDLVGKCGVCEESGHLLRRPCCDGKRHLVCELKWQWNHREFWRVGVDVLGLEPISIAQALALHAAPQVPLNYFLDEGEIIAEEPGIPQRRIVLYDPSTEERKQFGTNRLYLFMPCGCCGRPWQLIPIQNPPKFPLFADKTPAVKPVPPKLPTQPPLSLPPIPSLPSTPSGTSSSSTSSTPEGIVVDWDEMRRQDGAWCGCWGGCRGWCLSDVFSFESMAEVRMFWIQTAIFMSIVMVIAGIISATSPSTPTSLTIVLCSACFGSLLLSFFFRFCFGRISKIEMRASRDPLFLSQERNHLRLSLHKNALPILAKLPPSTSAPFLQRRLTPPSTFSSSSSPSPPPTTTTKPPSAPSSGEEEKKEGEGMEERGKSGKRSATAHSPPFTAIAFQNPLHNMKPK